jgi:hypothetical protein
MNLISLQNKNIKKIVCVYQLNYTNQPSPGFGDFIRGCFYVMQLSKLLNIDFELDISNHPIEKYIENSGKNPVINYDKLEFIIGHNRPANLWKNKNKCFDLEFANTLIDKLNNYHDSDTYAFFTNAFPIFYNFLDNGREKIRNMLKPKNFMQEYIDNTLNEIKLEKNTYATIHIRTGDYYIIKKKNIRFDFLNDIKQKIYSSIVPHKKYLIISDSSVIKSELKSYSNENFYIINTKIEHLGGDIEELAGDNYKWTYPGIMNTLLDFYLMSYSNSILSLSVYGHISGFSKYCAAVYNIPHVFIKLQDTSV